MVDRTEARISQVVRASFAQFLGMYRKAGEIEPHYIPMARELMQANKHTLYVRLEDIRELDTDVVEFVPSELRDAIEQQYYKLLPHLCDAVGDFMQKQTVDRDLAEWSRKQPKFGLAFHGLEVAAGLRDLRTGDLGRLMAIHGTVTRTSDIRPELRVGVFECMDCNRRIGGIQQQFKLTEPVNCTNPLCRNTTRWLNRREEGECCDWQKMRIQEDASAIPAGSMPRSIDVIVRDEICEKCKPGDNVMVTGSMIVVPDVANLMNPSELKTSVVRKEINRGRREGLSDGITGLKELGMRSLSHKHAFLGCFVQKNEQNKDDKQEIFVNIRPEVEMDGKDFKLDRSDKDFLEELSRDPKVFDRVAAAVAPMVHGHLDVKKGLLLLLVGGMSKQTHESIKLRGDINMCICGDPSTAKSQFLKWVSKFLPRGVLASGQAASAAGLTAAVIKDTDTGDAVIEPGALMLADNGICCIDEFEQMNSRDQVAIHEAMEQQTITLSKAGIQATLNARTSLLAAAAPRTGRYDVSRSLSHNVDISPPIMSRFDLFYVIIDKPEEECDDELAQHITALHTGKAAAQEAQGLSRKQLQQFIRMARDIHPSFTTEARDMVVKQYRSLRQAEGVEKFTSRVTVRQLESLVRLSEAIARVHLVQEVTPKHVLQAVQLMRASIRKVEATDKDLGEVDDSVGQAAPEPEAAAAAVVPPAKKRVTVSMAEYEKVARMLAGHLRMEANRNVAVTYSDLVDWYLLQVEHKVTDENELWQETFRMKKILDRLIEVDKVIVVTQQAENKDDRVLAKHPNFKES
mmetsp:Transcript_51155/g.134732  ORF Transcript_51155/g.134732 Transcript_51155/m.134732 type:complete len:800 (-) Transcript_51155:266-2665(-)